jgi:hypothetical protein
MKIPRFTVRQVLIVVLVIALTQAGSSTFQRYINLQANADALVASEGVFRQMASVRQELSPNLREVAALARELAKSASTHFERSKWLEMAQAEEDKATKADHEAVRLLIQADEQASRANRIYRASWRPWLAEPD